MFGTRVTLEILLHEKVKNRAPTLSHKLRTKSLKSKPHKTMKKLLYIFLLAFVCALTVTACTEEEVKPTSELDNGGGAGAETIRKE
jgi:hypothetical protein